MKTQIVMMPLSRLSKELNLGAPVAEAIERVVADPVQRITFSAPKGPLNRLGITIQDPKGEYGTVAGVVNLSTASNPQAAFAIKVMKLSKEFAKGIGEARYKQLENEKLTHTLFTA